MLHEFLLTHRDAIVARARAKVGTRSAPQATEIEIQRGVPLFVDQLIETLRGSPTSGAAIGESANRHGGDLLRLGFTVAQVVHDYGGVCQAVTEIAHETQAPITADEFNTFNRCLDDAIAGAVTEFSRQREKIVAGEGTERMGELAHELRNALGAAMLAFQTLRTGTVGLGGATSSLLRRSLERLGALIDSSLVQVRLDAKSASLERVSVREFIEELEVGATMEANNRGLTLSVTPVDPGVYLLADRQLLVGAVSNLLQNAFKFTHPHGHVALRTSWSRERVLVEVEDQCGGLPDGAAEGLFRPFEQRSGNRDGLGLGLSIARKSVEANGGEVRMRNLPGVGCVLTVDLPRLTSVL